MNYLNPYIALGGRNPFRACFINNKFALVQQSIFSMTRLQLQADLVTLTTNYHPTYHPIQEFCLVYTQTQICQHIKMDPSQNHCIEFLQGLVSKLKCDILLHNLQCRCRSFFFIVYYCLALSNSQLRIEKGPGLPQCFYHI